ncbi:hypothetical protein [Chloroflexus sp.]|uniref:hypothetical protein n=1 Tax=Chloroflexus sp. TaxID=1904827 RepID=UPI00298F07C3|nr:hypothetical protein [Chloroflexus sp.]MCS6887965.1 hypothetical protein [Chloroflexus sp.]MCX7860837.1 hypothetical protein [Chloroflexus sp.]MDW8403468.1 hypothetical protein [Chloroflexus sp.]
MRQRIPMIVILIGALAAIAWSQRPDRKLHVILLPTAGDAILIQSPAGSFTLIDGGSDPTNLAVELGAYLPFWQRHLAAIVLTHAGERNLPGQLGVLRRYQTALALAPVVPNGEWRDLLRATATPVRQLQAGQQLDLGGARLRVLATHDGKDGGAVLLIEYRATRVLIHTGGSRGDPALAALAGQKIDLLIYPWQRPATTPALSNLHLRAVAFSAGFTAAEPALHSFHDRKQLAPNLYHPKLDGAIHFISDGRQTTITTRPP